MTGGYDDGYRACGCFWGHEPGSLLTRLVTSLQSVGSLRALDAGCGEGKNAVYLAAQGANVIAADISPWAIINAHALHRDAKANRVAWVVSDVGTLRLPSESFDIVVAYGLLHCQPDVASLIRLVDLLKVSTRAGGHHVVCTFNGRYQDLRAHPGFSPTLLAHADILSLYSDWQIVEESDRDLVETHPHNNIEHTHSMTRLIARRPQ